MAYKRRPDRRRWGVKLAAVAGTASLMTLGTVTAAQAAPGDYSEAQGQFLDSNLLNLQLADAAYTESGFPSDPAAETNPLNVGALDALDLQLQVVGDGVEVPLVTDGTGAGLLDLGQAGAVQSYAATGPNSAIAASGAVSDDGTIAISENESPEDFGNATVNLTDLLGQLEVSGLTDDVVDTMALDVGALASRAEWSTAGVASDYRVADLGIDIHSLLVAGIADSLDGAVATVGAGVTDDVNALTGEGGAVSTVLAGIDLDTGVLDVTVGEPQISLDIPDLDSVVTTALGDGIVVSDNNAVTVDLLNGTITVDLAALVNPGGSGLNGLPANTSVLTADTISLITAGVTNALGKVTGPVLEGVQQALEQTPLTLSIPLTASAGLPPLVPEQTVIDTDIVISGTLAEIAAGTVEPTVDIALLPGLPSALTALVNPLLAGLTSSVTDEAVTPVLGALGGPVQTILTDASTDLAPALDAVIGTALDTLSPVLDGVLADAAAVTVNQQPTPGDLGADSFTVRALSLTLLPGVVGSSLATVDLASSTVRAEAITPVAITSPADGDVLPTAPGEPATDVPVSGTGQPGATVTVTIGDQTSDPVVVAGDGTWSTTVADVPAGAYDTTAAQDVDGSTDTVGVTVTETAADPVDVSIAEPEAGAELLIPSGDTTIDVPVSGAGEAGATVTVSVAGQPDHTTQVGVDGQWSVTFASLPADAYTATAVQDVDGSDATVDFSVSPAPTVADPVDITSPEPDSDIATAPGEPDADVEISGTGEPGAIVTVTVGETEVTAIVSDDGTWSVSAGALPAGSYTATATQNVDESTDDVAFSVTETPADVAITAPEPGESIPTAPGADTADAAVSGTGEPGAPVDVSLDGGAPVTVTVGDDGVWTTQLVDVAPGTHRATATQFPGTADESVDETGFAVTETPADLVITSPEDGADIATEPGADTGDVPVSGTGEPGATVTVSTEDGVEATATVGDDGSWSATLEDVAPGDHTITATQEPGGESDAVDVTVTETPAPVDIAFPSDGSELNAGTESTLDVPLLGTGEPGATVTVSIEGQADQTAEVDGDGNWSITTPLPVGDHTASAVQDVDGSTDSVDFTIAAGDGDVAPVAITGPEEGTVVDTAPGDPTADVEASGTGEPGAIVTVSVDGGDGVPAVVDGDGTWSATLEDVPAGSHTVAAVQNLDESSDTVSFEVSATPAADVEITSPGDGDTISAGPGDTMTDLVVEGTGEPGTEVEVSLDGGDGQTVTVGDDGTWNTAFDDVPVGDHVITASDGNTEDSVSVTVDEGSLVTPPRAVVQRSTIVRGTGVEQHVYATGFVPGETVSGTVYSTPFALEPAVADENGNVTFSFLIDADFELGDHHVEVAGSVSGELPDPRELTEFTVIDAVVPGADAGAGSGTGAGAGGASGSLPRTGADSAWLGTVAVLLLLAGAAAYRRSRRTVS